MPTDTTQHQKPTFDCPRCSKSTSYESELRGAVGVAIHFYLRHPVFSFFEGLRRITMREPKYDPERQEDC